MARRYATQPSCLVPSAWHGLDESAREWFDLILAWLCVSNADAQLRDFVLAEKGRGGLVVPTVPITDWPR